MRKLLPLTFALGVGVPLAAFCDCRVVDHDKSLAFDGATLNGLLIEKKSLVTLNKTYPSLNAVERVYKGELQTCSNCTEKYVTCSN